MLTFLTGEKYLPFEELRFQIYYNIYKQLIQVHLKGRYGSALHGNNEWSGIESVFGIYVDQIILTLISSKESKILK